VKLPRKTMRVGLAADAAGCEATISEVRLAGYPEPASRRFLNLRPETRNWVDSLRRHFVMLAVTYDCYNDHATCSAFGRLTAAGLAVCTANGISCGYGSGAPQ